MGFTIVGLFALTWAVAAAVWRFGRVEDRWAIDPGSTNREDTASQLATTVD